MDIQLQPGQARAQRLHNAASSRGDSGYIDPSSGLLVLTSFYLKQRGYCCGAGCRHCPYPPAVQDDAGRAPDAPCWEVPNPELCNGNPD